MIKCRSEWFQKRLEIDNGVYDRAAYNSLMEYCSHYDTVIDIGAHCGSWSLAFAEQFNNVIAIEADPMNYAYLEDNIAESGVNNIKMYNIAIGEKEQEVNVIQHATNCGKSYVVPGSEMKMTTLDILCADIPNIDLIKIDTEGYELPILLGAENVITTHRPMIILENNGLAVKRYGIAITEIAKHMYTLGYGCVLKYEENEVWKYVRTK